MFRNKTAFILGAGASWHYGYPTGEELVKKVIQKAYEIDEYFRGKANSDPTAVTARPDFIARGANVGLKQMRVQWQESAAECKKLAEALEHVRPLVIDYFLWQNPSLRRVGKLMIAWVLLECEARYVLHHGNMNRREALDNSPFRDDREKVAGLEITKFKDAWCRFVLQRLVSGCGSSGALLENDVRFITFNYDVSLEEAIFQGLSHTELFDDEHVADFFAGDRVTHVYGKIRDYPSATGFSPIPIQRWVVSRQDGISKFEQDKSVIDEIDRASQKLRTIDPIEKDAADLESARGFLADASCIYILGYGFDEANSKRLALHKTLRLDARTGKSVMFTNYMDSNRVNKLASLLFFGSFDEFLPPRPSIRGRPQEGFYCEKSTRSVYEALEMDFDTLEDRLTGGTNI